MNRIFFCCAFVLAACGQAGGAGPERGDLSVDITQAPSDANCISVTVSGANRQATRLEQALAPGVSTVFNLTGIPTGAVVVTAFATPSTCDSRPTWLSDPVSALIPAGSVASLTLVLHRNGRAAVAVDFQDDIKTVSTLAGSPTLAGNVDGTGNAARFSLPSGVWSDGAGDLFVADALNYTIRQVIIATGAVSTLAGSGTDVHADGTGKSASFLEPSGIVGDGLGNLYVTEDCSVRKVTVPGAVVTTLAGGICGPGADGTGSAASFAGLVRNASIATDGTSLYFSDVNDATIRMLTLSTGAVSTLAGAHGASGSVDGLGAAARLYQPQGVALDAASGFLYFGDGNVLRRLTLSTGAVVTIAGGISGLHDGAGTDARFLQIAGLAFDGANLWITDSNSVRKFYPQTGVVVTVAGSASAGHTDGSALGASFYNAGGMALDNTQGAQLFVADLSNNTIRNLQ